MKSRGSITIVSLYDGQAGQNLIRNSNNLIFEDYKFMANIVDESKNRIVDESGNSILTII